MNIIKSIFAKSLSIIKNIGILITIIVGIIMTASAYCGYIDPEDSAKFAIIGMIFPIMLILHLFILIIWLITRRWLISLLSVAFLATCYPAVSTFSPLNFCSKNTEDSDSTFKVLTYNVMNFDDFENIKGENRTLRYILDKNADFVILQEASAKIKMDNLDLIQQHIPELNSKYPYREQRLRDVVILSKYPYTVENERLDEGNKPYKKSAIYKVNIKGRELYIIGVHLESLRLTDNDKALYKDITNISSSSEKLNEKIVEDVKSGLLTKLATAFKQRATQAKNLREYINSLDHKNIILCGDFNDTPFSFSYNTIMGDDMSDAYKECALGPTITFHDNRFYFRIDHIMYKGDFEAIDIERGNDKSSDHYPLMATFKWI
ncbi:MAG: hypothetical protein E7080_02690 [Bacteroidales bacterium]|nr:hypothetical protein [Bacteroidales bacterium]